jgi:hypothetical protein
MKTSYAVVFAVMITSVAVADERRSAPAAPKPRVRLDPITRTAVADPKKEARKESSDSVIKMSPFVVKSTPIITSEPEQENRPTAPFSPMTGGWIARKDAGGARIELGVWPYYNIMWKTDRFKSDLKHVGTEFVRISW